MAFHINQILQFLAMYLVYSCMASAMVMNGGKTSLKLHAKGGIVEAKMGMSMFTVRLHALTELKTNGDPVVQNPNTQKHAYDMFKEKDFTLEAPTYKNATLPAYHMKEMNTMVPLGGSANITVKFFSLISEGNGTITPDGEPAIDDVVTGMVCTRVEISGWEFCDGSAIPCNNSGTMETGDLLDAKFEISANGVSGTPNTTASKITFGKASIMLPKQVKIDTSAAADMATGYPKFEVVNGKLHVTIRIPKFSIMAKYGQVCVNLMETGPTSGAATLAAGLTSFIALFAAFWIH